MSVTIHAYAHALGDEMLEPAIVDAGQTLAEICGTDRIVASINGRTLPAHMIQHMRLKAGETPIVVRPIPQNGGILKTVLLVGVTIAAAAVTGGLAAGALGAGTLAAGSLGASVAGAAVGIVGSLAINTLIPPQQPDMSGRSSGSFDRANSITGQSNQIAQYEPIPRLYGRHLYYPPIPSTARPYTEISGNDQYYRMLVCLGWGPLDFNGTIVGGNRPPITDASVFGDLVKIGDTNLENYDDVDVECGRPDQITLYADQPIDKEIGWQTEATDEITNSNEHSSDGQQTIRTTDTGADEFAVDFSCSLYSVDSDGDTTKAHIGFRMEWRLAGSSDPWFKREFYIISYERKTIRHTERVKTFQPGSYDVRMTRFDTYHDDATATANTAVWTTLRTIRSRRAFDVPGTVCLALRIRATDQINGRIQQLSVEPTAVLWVYDQQAGRWEEQATRQHAWALTDIVTGPANRRPYKRSDLELESILGWDARNQNAGRTFDMVYDNNGTTRERMAEVAGAGRATVDIMTDTRIGVVVDAPQTTPKPLVTPRNSFGYSYTLTAYSAPNKLRVRYVDSETWENAEVVVYDDGFDEATAETEGTTDARGATNAAQAIAYGVYQLANMRLRGIEEHRWSQDIQHLRYKRGSVVAMAQDAILVGQNWGRIKTVELDDDGRATAVTTDELLQMPDINQTYGIRIDVGGRQLITTQVVTEPPASHRVELKAPLAGIEAGQHIAFGPADRITTDLRIKSIEPRGDLQAEMTAEPYAPEVFEAENGDIASFNPQITLPIDLSRQPPPPPILGEIVSDETVASRNDDGSLNWRVQVNVSARSGRVRTESIAVQIKRPDATIWETATARDGVAYFADVDPGIVIDVRIRAEGGDRSSDWVYQYGYRVTGRIPAIPVGVSITRGTFEATFEPKSNRAAAVFDFYLSASELALDTVETSARLLPTGRTSRADDLEPETDYWLYYRARNAYGISAFAVASFQTKNEPNKRLEYATDAILDGPAGSNPFATLRASNEKLADDLDQEAADRNAAVEAEAQSRADALLNERNARQAAIENETKQRQSADESLAQSVSTLSAGTGEQFDTAEIWYFDADTEGWTGSTGVKAQNGYLIPNNGDAPTLVSPTGVGVNSDTYRYVKARIVRNGAPGWVGDLYWRVAGDSTWHGPKTLEQPTFADDIATIAWTDIEWSGTIDQIRIDLAPAQDTGNWYSLDWLAIGRPTPGASVAALQRESAARIENDSAEAMARETLAAQMRGDYSGTDPAQLSQGLLHRERQARVQQNEATARDVESVQARVGKNETAITDEREARVKEDSALGSRIESLRVEFIDPETGERRLARIDELQQVAATADAAIARYALEVTGQTSDGNPITGRIVAGSDGETADLVLDFDRLLVGRNNSAGVAPFVLDSDGNIIANSALIDSLTIGKLVTADGRSALENGQFRTDLIQARRLEIGYDQVDGDKPGLNGDNKVNKTKFSDMLSGAWDAETRTPSDATRNNPSYLLIRGQAYTLERGNAFSVTPGERIWCRAYVRTKECSTSVGLGIYGNGREARGFTVPRHREWSYIEGELVVPDGMLTAVPMVRADESGNYGYAQITYISITRYQPGANVTGEHTSRDVETGSDRAVRERGADATGNHTSRDTHTVDGESARTVRLRADEGSRAEERTRPWQRPGTTLIEPGVIATDTAFITHLMLKNNAVTRTTTAQRLTTKDFKKNEEGHVLTLAIPPTNTGENETALLAFSSNYEFDDDNSTETASLRINSTLEGDVFDEIVERDTNPDARKNFSLQLPIQIRHDSYTYIRMYMTLGGDNTKSVYFAYMTCLDLYDE